MVPTFLERWLGIRPPEPGEGLVWEFTQRFPWPVWLTVLLAAGMITFVVMVYRRDADQLSGLKRGTLTALRLCCLAILLFFLTELALSVERTGLPTLLVLLDTSSSMKTPDVGATSASGSADSGKPRWDAARQILTGNNASFLKALLSRHKVQIHAVDTNDRPLAGGELVATSDLAAVTRELEGISPDGEQSRLGDGLRKLISQLRGTPPSAVILFTDGIVTEGERLSAAARLARQKSVPVLPVALGRSEPALDLELLDALVNDVAFVGDPVSIDCRIASRGLAGQSAVLKVRLADKDDSLATTRVNIPGAGNPVRAELTFTPNEVGEFEYLVEVEPATGERNVTNNVRKRRISVRKDKIRVLLLDREPRWEFRELKALLEREKTVDLKVLLQDADPEYAREDRFALASMPVRREEIFQYDVILVGDIEPAFLSSTTQELLRDFVRDNGGGLVLIAGPTFNPWGWKETPLDPLFPVDLATTLPSSKAPAVDPYRLELTGEGIRGVPFFRLAEGDVINRQAWQRMPGWLGLVESPDLKRGAQALATHPLRTGSKGKLPVISIQRYGGGKVVYHASDESWRWRFRTGDLYFGRYWVQLIRFLARSKLLGRDRVAEIVADRQTYRAGEPVSLRVRFLDERRIPEEGKPVTLIVESRDHDGRRTLKLEHSRELEASFEAQLPGLPEGLWRAWLAEPAFGANPPDLEFRVESPARESRVLETDLAELSATAELTGGKVYTVETVSKLPQELPRGAAVPLENNDPLPLWNHWLTFVVFCTTLSLEWILRKRWRLV